MFIRTMVLTCAIGAVSTATTLPAAAQSTFPPDSVIQRLLDERVSDGRAAGIVLGLVEHDGSTRILTAGTAGAGRTLDAGSVFEIGSITKVFTALLLADMVRRGEVSLDDPVSKFLPEGVTMPSREGKPITLGQLSSQTSGLPRLPGNLRPADALNPYADYTVAQLYEFLGGHQLRRDPGTQFEYSNLGVGLLGHVLALRAGMSYEDLVRQRILQPLGMEHTGITLTPVMRARMVAGHNLAGDTVPLWDLPTLAGAGALRSSMADMLRFAQAAVRPDGPLQEAFSMSLQPRTPAGSLQAMIGLGWLRFATGSDTIAMHNGGTGGFRTFIGLQPSAGRAVVLLTNTGGPGSDDIGMHLLNPALPLAPAPRQAVDVPVTVLERYAGTYELSPQFSIVVTLVDGALYGTATGQQTIRLWPASETQFFIREVEAEVSFEVATDGTVTGLVLHQGGRSTPGRRITQ
jgi:serine-type D-Ala-D-Ala carboxypeptidase/endopeptidase